MVRTLLLLEDFLALGHHISCVTDRGIDHGLPYAIRVTRGRVLEEIARKQGLRVNIPADCLFAVPVERMRKPLLKASQVEEERNVSSTWCSLNRSRSCATAPPSLLIHFNLLVCLFHRRQAVKDFPQALVGLLQLLGQSVHQILQLLEVLKRGRLLHVSLWDVAKLRVERRQDQELGSGVQEMQILVANEVQSIHLVFHRAHHLRVAKVLLDGTQKFCQSVTPRHECLGRKLRW